jgi:hypothetical protein
MGFAALSPSYEFWGGKLPATLPTVNRAFTFLTMFIVPNRQG